MKQVTYYLAKSKTNKTSYLMRYDERYIQEESKTLPNNTRFFPSATKQYSK